MVIEYKVTNRTSRRDFNMNHEAGHVSGMHLSNSSNNQVPVSTTMVSTSKCTTWWNLVTQLWFIWWHVEPANVIENHYWLQFLLATIMKSKQRASTTHNAMEQTRQTHHNALLTLYGQQSMTKNKPFEFWSRLRGSTIPGQRCAGRESFSSIKIDYLAVLYDRNGLMNILVFKPWSLASLIQVWFISVLKVDTRVVLSSFFLVSNGSPWFCTQFLMDKSFWRLLWKVFVNAQTR